MAAADHVMLKDKDGKDVMVRVTKKTKVKAKPAVRVEDITVGSRIVITAVEEKDNTMTAKSIEGGAGAAGKEGSPKGTEASHEDESSLCYARGSCPVPRVGSRQRPASRV